MVLQLYKNNVKLNVNMNVDRKIDGHFSKSSSRHNSKLTGRNITCLESSPKTLSNEKVFVILSVGRSFTTTSLIVVSTTDVDLLVTSLVFFGLKRNIFKYLYSLLYVQNGGAAGP